MSIIDRLTLKNLFKTARTPSQQDYWNWFDSYIHKNDKISTDQVTGLSDALAAKLDTEASDNILKAVQDNSTTMQALKDQTVLKYNDAAETVADDIIKTADQHSKEPANYITFDYSDSEQDGVVYKQIGGRKMKRQFTGSLKASWYGVVGNGINDDSAALQNAINAAILLSYDLEIDGTVLITKPINIDRAVDDPRFDNFLVIFSNSNAKILINAPQVMFSTSLSFTDHPVTQLVNFRTICFEAAAVSGNNYVLDDGKFLRTQFNNCSFVRMNALNAVKSYTQSIYFFHCNIRRFEGNFFTSPHHCYDLKVNGCLIESGNGIAFSLQKPHGSSIIGCTIEGMANKAIEYINSQGFTVMGNYFEENGVDIDGLAGTSEGVAIIGNSFVGDDWRVKWGGIAKGCVAFGNNATGKLHLINEKSEILINDFSYTGEVTNITNPTNIKGYGEGSFSISTMSSAVSVQSSGSYTKVGACVTFSVKVAVPQNTSADAVYLAGLPFPTRGSGNANQIGGTVTGHGYSQDLFLYSNAGEGAFKIGKRDGSILTYADLSGQTIYVNANYFI